jgi:hypothetical protein
MWKRDPLVWLGIFGALFLAYLATGCSANRISEQYSPDGALASRTWNSHQVGTTRQSTMQMEQVDGAYNIATGENVRVDNKTVEIVRIPIDAALGAYGLHSLRRGEALAPVSVDSAGALQTQQINELQQQILLEREANKRVLAELQAQIEMLKAAGAHGE